MRRVHARVIAAGPAVLMSAACAVGQQVNTQVSGGQTPPAQGNGRFSFTRVEPAVADVDPLRTSLRTYPTDLRQPMGFRDVFRISGSGPQATRLGFASASGQDLMARRDGAVTAVFPQSVYIETRQGVVPEIPPGTIFFIGDLPQDPFAGQADVPDAPNKVHSRIETRADAALAERSARLATPEPQPMERTDQPPTGTPDGRGSIMTDEALRASSVRILLQRAAESADVKREKDETPPAAPKKDI